MIEQYQKIVTMLLSLTKEGKVEWEKTSSNEYKAYIGENGISVKYHEPVALGVFSSSTPDNIYVKLLLWNQNGQIIDEVKSEKNGHGFTDFDLLQSLYLSARRSYGKVNDVLDTVISDLNKATQDNHT